MHPAYYSRRNQRVISRTLCPNTLNDWHRMECEPMLTPYVRDCGGIAALPVVLPTPMGSHSSLWGATSGTRHGAPLHSGAI